MLNLSDIFHTGFVVEDLDAAMTELGSVFEVWWTAVEDREMPVVGPDGPRTVNLRFVYSLGPAPRIELLAPVAGTVWEVPVQPAGGVCAAHHVGVWCDDFVATSRRYVELGYPRVMTFDDGSGEAARFAYHRLPSGPLVELVDARRRPVLEAWFAGADYPATS